MRSFIPLIVLVAILAIQVSAQDNVPGLSAACNSATARIDKNVTDPTPTNVATCNLGYQITQSLTGTPSNCENTYAANDITNLQTACSNAGGIAVYMDASGAYTFSAQGQSASSSYSVKSQAGCFANDCNNAADLNAYGAYLQNSTSYFFQAAKASGVSVSWSASYTLRKTSDGSTIATFGSGSALYASFAIIAISCFMALFSMQQ